MSRNIVHPLALKNPSVVLVTVEGKTIEHPTVTCKHCGRVYSLRCDNPKVSFSDIAASVARCTKCDGYVCPSPACRADCAPFKADVERAISEKYGQPWLLRDGKLNEPVFRIRTDEGEKLIPRRQSGYTDRELARMA